MRSVSANHRVNVDVAQVWSSPLAPRTIDEPMLRPIPDVAIWMAELDTTARRDLLGRVETQALFGEPVVVVSETGDWCEVRLPLQPTSKDLAGYPGWIRRDHLRADDRQVQRLLVTSRWALLYQTPHGLPDGALSMGSPVEIVDRTENERPDVGRYVYIQTPKGLRYINELALSARPAPIAVAGDMLGMPYLWSGLSAWGVDCSGLVHLSNRVAGLTVPRDSVDQFDARVSHTVYFRHSDEHERAGRIHHVGFEVGGGLMLHAPKTGRVVELMTLDTPPYDQELHRFSN
jgi:gamma-D-glutamyl-L-lysine dipeptidyl-peptidase